MSVEPVKAQGHNLLDGEVFINGRIDNVDRYEDKIYTRVILPAVDEFSRPQVVLIGSKRQLGQVGSTIKVVGRIGGYANDYNGKNGRVHSARITLELAE